MFTAMSDRIGRKPPMIVGGTMMAIGPIALLLMPGTPATFTAMMFIGWMGMGIFPLFMGVVPAETSAGRVRRLPWGWSSRSAS